VTTGKKRTEPTLSPFVKMIGHGSKMMAEIKTYDQQVYELAADRKTIKIKLG
jgi:hypothetical protein